jgi:hypothetical protein
MRAERDDAAMIEAPTEIERALQTALAIEPSPEFVARVRTRLAHEPVASVWRPAWLMVSAGAMAAAIAIAIVVSNPHQQTPASPAAEQRRSQAESPRPGALPAEAARRDAATTNETGGDAMPRRPRQLPAVQPSAMTRASEPLASAGRPASGEPEILIDPREAAALRWLITGTRDGSLDLSAALQTTMPAAPDPPPLSEIAIPLITIDPITPEAGDEGARQ